MNWNEKFMGLAKHIATWSKDESTKVGAVITDNHRIISVGYNGLPNGAKDDVEARKQRPLKYKWAEHGERNAIYNAARVGTSTEGAIMYVNYFPCTDCARAIIQSGIKMVIFEKILPIERNGNLKDPQWGEDFLVAFKMLKECNIEIAMMDLERGYGIVCSLNSVPTRLGEIIGVENWAVINDYIYKRTDI